MTQFLVSTFPPFFSLINLFFQLRRQFKGKVKNRKGHQTTTLTKDQSSSRKGSDQVEEVPLYTLLVKVLKLTYEQVMTAAKRPSSDQSPKRVLKKRADQAEEVPLYTPLLKVLQLT